MTRFREFYVDIGLFESLSAGGNAGRIGPLTSAFMRRNRWDLSSFLLKSRLAEKKYF